MMTFLGGRKVKIIISQEVAIEDGLLGEELQMTGNDFDVRWWLLNIVNKIPNPELFYQSFLIFFFVGFLFLAIAPNRNRSLLFSDGLFLLFLCLFMLAGRWPCFLAPTLDLDEDQFIAAAMKLLRDPIYWRSADTGSSGPLNIYPLMLPALFGLKLEYAVSRLIGLGCNIIAIVCLYYSFRCIYGKTIARIASIPVVSTWAPMLNTDLVHYAGETFPVMLLSIALLVVCKYYSSSSSSSNRLPLFLGIILGSIPYAKFQGVPIAAMVVLIFLHVLWRKRLGRRIFLKSMLSLMVGVCLFSVVIMLYLSLFALFDDFWKSYICHNLLFYSTTCSDLPLWEKLIHCLQTQREILDANILFILTYFILIVGFLFLLYERVQSNSSNEGKKAPVVPVFIYYALALLLASFYSVMMPGTNYPHYFLFLIIPSGFLIGAFLGEFMQRKPHLYPIICILILAVSALQFFERIKTKNPYLLYSNYYAQYYGTPVGKVILRYASSGESMAIWGWSPQLYVETGLIQATRDAVSIWQFWPSPLQKYYLDRYIKDMEKSAPKLFVDASNHSPTIMINRNQNHELCPEIDGLVKRHYTFAEEIEGVRIYTRRKNAQALAER